MKEKGRLLKDAFVIGATGMALNLVGLWFNIYLSDTLGTEGIGLFQLIASAYMLATTFATSGINLSVTRIVAEALSLAETRGTATRRFRKCLLVSAVLGLCACALLFFFSGIIAGTVLGRPETEICFRILAFGLPFMSMGSCLNGFFVAERKAYKTAVANGTEELCKVAFTLPVSSPVLSGALMSVAFRARTGASRAPFAKCFRSALRSPRVHICERD